MKMTTEVRTDSFSAESPVHAVPGGARSRESRWLRVSLVVGVMVLAAVAIFMLPKIGGRSSRLQTQADARTEIWKKQLLESGNASAVAQEAPSAEALWVVGLIVGAGGILAALAYAALRPRKPYSGATNAEKSSKS